MKTNHVFGILWLALCSWFSVSLLWVLSRIYITDVRPTPDLFLAIGMCLISLLGVVTSIFLFRDARWARFLMSIVAVLFLASCIVHVITFQSLSIWSAAIGIFALVSIILFLYPSRKVAA
jgi:hypothetical protein